MVRMATRNQRTERRTDALSKERIVEAAIEILDDEGETALTFRALSARLATGSGAIYWHVANKSELLAAATDDVIARVTTEGTESATPREAIRIITLGVFDAIDAHPWVGTQLSREPWQSAVMKIFESLGTQLQTLGVPESAQFDCASALLNYVLGLAGQYAAGARLLPARQTDPLSFRPSPHDGKNSTLRSTRSSIRCRHNCATTTTANSFWQVSISSSRGSTPPDSSRSHQRE
ncbi:hypothetical protein GCM10020255_067450 [Rhodococcus baikonurensis]